MDSSKTPKYYQDRYQELMKKELQNAYESNAKISIANFPTGSGKSYLTRQLHKILKLRKTDVIIGDETIPFQRVILTYPTREQCQASVRAIQTMKDQDHDQDIHLLYLRSLEDQINTIKDLRNTNRDEYRHLMQDIANAFKACTDTKDSKQQLRDIEDIEDSFQTLFVVIERNKAKKEENQNCVLVIDRQPESSVKDFKNIYQQLYKAMHENEDLITPRIKMYFPDLQFDRSNIVVCTHHKTFNSLLPFRSANIDSKIDRHSKKDDADENDKPVNKSELEIRNILVIDEIEKFIDFIKETTPLQGRFYFKRTQATIPDAQCNVRSLP